MKELNLLTKEEFETLKQTGLLKSIYPEAPEFFEDIHIKRPTPLDNPDFTKLINLTEQYLDGVKNPNKCYIKDIRHLIFETAIDCIYGENNVWDYLIHSVNENQD